MFGGGYEWVSERPHGPSTVGAAAGHGDLDGRRDVRRPHADDRCGGDVRQSCVVGGDPPNGVWPGVGKICEPGPGGASSVRGVSPKTINIAVFNDAANTIEPGLEAEFPQQAKAFAAWCNASGGINGRKIVIDNRDAALFNAAQQATAACQSDFMAVGGGMALDQPSVPVREQCGLGQISGYVVSDAAELASDQVNPSGGNTNSITSGWFGALAKAYPQAVKKAGMGGANEASVLEAERKDEYGAEAQGWNVLDFQEPPISVTDWAPYIEQVQSKGVEALWPSLDDNIVPYFQSMTTAGYHPAFVILGVQFYNSTTTKGVADNPALSPVYVETSWWPLEMASQNPSTDSSSTSCTRTPRATPSTSTTRRVLSLGSCGRSPPRPVAPT